MRVALGSDHRGHACKQALAGMLRGAGHDVRDFGCAGPEACDYPDPAFAAAEAVAAGACERAILVCGSGIGVCIAANKVRGARAALCFDVAAAAQTRRHNDSNVLCLSGDATPPDRACEIARVWLATAFEGGRHARRVQKITDYEARHSAGAGLGAPDQPRPGKEEPR